MGGIAGMAMLLGPTSVSAQARAPSADTYAVPRTPWGDPDLQGMWVNNSATPLQRPHTFAGKATLTDEELADLKAKADEVVDGGDAFFGDDFVRAALAEGTAYRSFDTTTGNYNQFWIEERTFEDRTSLIVYPRDGRLPALTPEGRERSAARMRARASLPAGPEDLTLQARCLTYGVPNILAGYNSYSQILQSRDYVVLVQELIHDVRMIPLDGRPHLSGAITQWHGNSRGRWEGDTLVVDTTNFSAQSSFRGAGKNLHLTERFTRVDADTVAYTFTVDDPTTFTEAWTAMIPWKSSADPMFEYACHEGNTAVAGILLGARAAEKNPEAK